MAIAGFLMIVEDLISISRNDVNKNLHFNYVGTRTRIMQIRHKNAVTSKPNIVLSITVTLNIEAGNDYISFEYLHGQKKIKNLVRLKPLESNVGKFWNYEFVCPVLGIKCRKLYFIGNQFVSRKAIKPIYYRQQVESKRKRKQLAGVRTINRYQKIIATSQEKYFMPEYAGVPTKKGKKVEKARRMLNAISD